MRITLADIAREAGVSVGAVSMALNGKPGVSDEVRQRIQRIAASLNYAAAGQKQADRLGTDKTAQFFVVHAAMIHPAVIDANYTVFAAYLQGIAQAAQEFGMQAHYVSTTALLEPAQIGHVIFRQLQPHVKGVIGIGINEGDPAYRLVQTLGIPIMLLNRRIFDAGASFVSLDQRAGVKMAIRYLVQRGHRRIVFGGYNRPGGFQPERLAGYRDGLQEAGIEYDPDLVIFPSSTEIESGDISADTIAALSIAALRRRQASAIFCMYPQLVAPVLRDLAHHRLAVPDDVSLITFDDVPALAAATPPITTVSGHHERIGYLAVRVLHDLIMDADVGSQHIILRPFLVERASVADCSHL